MMRPRQIPIPKEARRKKRMMMMREDIMEAVRESNVLSSD